MSLDIFPSRLKKNPKATYIRCKICGNEVDEDWTQQGICQDCLKKGDTYHCARCGCEMIHTNYQKYIKHSPRYEICKDCFNKRNMVYTTIRCSECGRRFEITNGEKEFYEKKGFQMPKKCKDCRGQKTYAQQPVYSSSRSSSTRSGSPTTGGSSRPSPKEHQSGWCFITTAACEYFGKPDDCYELTTLRQFRDGWLAFQPDGEAIIREYYQIAPPIVEALNISNQRDAIYTDIWQDYILPCVQMIEQGSYEACRALYEKMVLSLKQIVLKES